MQPNAGMTTMINATVTDGSKLGNFDFIKQSLYKLAEVAKMHILAETSVVVPPTPENVETEHDDGGISVTLIISTSSIHFHSWVLQNRFRLVLDSCKNYDFEIIKEFIRNTFDIDKIAYDVRPYVFPFDL